MAITTINIDSQVLTFANLAAFPLVGTVKTIYIAEDTNFQYYWDGVAYVLLTTTMTGGTVTSVGLTMPSAFTVTNSPITSSGDIAVTGAGLANQYVRGDGTLANFPTNGGGGSSVNYYLNGSVNQGTFGGDTYYELSKTPIIGVGTNFTRTNAQGNGYIASFITDAGDPNLLNIPAGNWHLEFYFNANSGGGSPSFYGELYKVSNTNVFTLIASGSTNPEGITQGTTVDQYFTSIPVPQTTLLATDRLAIRVYVNTGGRNITLHTEDNNLCQVITTFSTGLNALNGLTAQVQNFAVGTSGTDFAISSVTDTHTFNLPTASALNRGALSSADWSTFNGKVNTGNITSSGLTMATARLLGRGTAGSGAVEEIVIGLGLTLTGTTLSAAGSGITIGTTAISSGTVGRVLFEGAGNVVQQSANFFWDNTNGRLGIRVATPTASLEVLGAAASGTGQSFAVHNSTGNNNALIVTNDGLVGIGTNTPTHRLTINGDNTANNVYFRYIRRANSTLDIGNDGSTNAGTKITANSDVANSVLSLSAINTNAADTYNLGLPSFYLLTEREAGARNSNKVYLTLRNGASNLFAISPMQSPTGITTANSSCLVWQSGSGSVDALVNPETNSMGEMQIKVTTNPTPINFNLRNYFTTTNANQIASAPFLKFSGGYWNGAADVRVNSSIRSVITTTNYRVGIFNDSNEHLSVFNSGNVTIGTTTDVASSILTLSSITKGFLPPRMTTAQRDLIATPAEGLVIYNTTTQVLNFYNGAVWAAV